MNCLQYESSPYLLQHAHNPVDWYPWGEEALTKAQKEDKPILVSIGYSTCHWCHVMERESFEDKEVADFMNEHFVNIKIDREERPDIDNIYMYAVQVITGAGGWPLNCFLTPDGRPFYGGTYFPPMPAHNRPSWLQLLMHLKNTFTEKRDVVETQANRLVEVIENGDDRFINDQLALNDGQQPFGKDYIEKLYTKLEADFDKEYGGFGGAPKFPGTMALTFLLNHAHYTNHQPALDHLLFSLQKMINGGIYDHLGGGFARYTTDKAWLIPHFEKMLYDNALLVALMAKAYIVTSEPWLKTTIEETLTYINREMTDSKGGFYSALDADSEEVEGKFYVWSKNEIQEALGEKAEWFCKLYNITEEGNWEGQNILFQSRSAEEVAAELGIELETLQTFISEVKEQLLQLRDQRIRPGLDDKILLSWNALQIIAYAQAYKAINNPTYKEAALNSLEFLWNNMRDDNGKLIHAYKDGKGKPGAFLEDYAFFINALIEGYEISSDTQYLDKALALTEKTLELFKDPEGNLFYYTAFDQTDLIVRKKEVYDSSIPSGNAVMAANLKRLGILFDKADFMDRSLNMLIAMKESVERYTNSFSYWAIEIQAEVFPFREVAVVGPDASSIIDQIYSQLYLPNAVQMASENENEEYPLLKAKTALPSGKPAIYLCQNYSCQRPVGNIEEFKQLMR